MQALDVGAVVQIRRDLLPVLGAELMYQLRQPLVLLLVPVPLVIVRIWVLLWRIHRFVLVAWAFDREHGADGPWAPGSVERWPHALTLGPVLVVEQVWPVDVRSILRLVVLLRLNCHSLID